MFTIFQHTLAVVSVFRWCPSAYTICVPRAFKTMYTDFVSAYTMLSAECVFLRTRGVAQLYRLVGVF